MPSHIRTTRHRIALQRRRQPISGIHSSPRLSRHPHDPNRSTKIIFETIHTQSTSRRRSQVHHKDTRTWAVHLNHGSQDCLIRESRWKTNRQTTTGRQNPCHFPHQHPCLPISQIALIYIHLPDRLPMCRSNGVLKVRSIRPYHILLRLLKRIGDHITIITGHRPSCIMKNSR